YRSRWNGDLPRPPRTLREQRRLIRDFRSGSTTTLNSVRVVSSLRQFRSSSVRLTNVNSTVLARQRSFQRSYRQLGVARQRLERPGRSLVGKPAPLSLARVPAGKPLPSGRLPGRSFDSVLRPERGAVREPIRPSGGRSSYRGYAPRYAPDRARTPPS